MAILMSLRRQFVWATRQVKCKCKIIWVCVNLIRSTRCRTWVSGTSIGLSLQVSFPLQIQGFLSGNRYVANLVYKVTKISFSKGKQNSIKFGKTRINLCGTRKVFFLKPRNVEKISQVFEWFSVNFLESGSFFWIFN